MHDERKAAEIEVFSDYEKVFAIYKEFDHKTANSHVLTVPKRIYSDFTISYDRSIFYE